MKTKELFTTTNGRLILVYAAFLGYLLGVVYGALR
jgi:hypothetical protein